jgi:hypothetical protein
MGVNAQIAVPAFTAGQVLTAAQQTQINTGIPVFATTVTRDAAFGGAGEKVLAEGQYAYIESTNQTLYYDGSSWLSVGTTPGMVFITGASFTAQSTISMPASTFTTTYKTYQVILQITAASTDIDVLCRVNVAGSPNSTSGQYAWGKGGVFYNSAANDQGNATSQTSALINEVRNSSYIAYATNSLIVYDPANSGTMTTANGTWVGGIDNNGIGATGFCGFSMTATAANDGLTFVTSSGTITGFYRVYGFNES